MGPFLKDKIFCVTVPLRHNVKGQKLRIRPSLTIWWCDRRVQGSHLGRLTLNGQDLTPLPGPRDDGGGEPAEQASLGVKPVRGALRPLQPHGDDAPVHDEAPGGGRAACLHDPRHLRQGHQGRQALLLNIDLFLVLIYYFLCSILLVNCFFSRHRYVPKYSFILFFSKYV